MPEQDGGGGAAACHHTFVKTHFLNRIGVMRCVGCSEVCFMLTPMRRCSICDAYYHEECFQKSLIPDESEVPPPPSSNGVAPVESPVPGASRAGYAEHVHEMHYVTLWRPDKCVVCSWLFVPGPKAALSCLECDALVHDGCLGKLPGRYDIVDETTVASRTASSDPRQDPAFELTTKLLQQFSAHHRNWMFSVINPVRMKTLELEHSAMYIEACDALLKSARETLPHSHLTDARRALRFATAVYGLAYASGGMAGAMSNLFLRTLQREMLRPKAESNNIATMQVLQLPRSNLLHSRWGKEVFEPSYALILDDDAQWIILAFRGSLSDQDFLTDACGHLTGLGDGQAHAGICAMIQKVFDDTQLMEAIREQRALHPTWKLIVTGHSLGGGLTEIFMMRAISERVFGNDGSITQEAPSESNEARRARGLKRLVEPDLTYHCDWMHGFAFAPPPVATMPMADRYDEVITSVVAAKDMVPRLQLSSVDRLGARLAQAKASGDAAPTVAGISDGVEECFIPGMILFTTKPNNVNTRLTYLDRTSILLRDVFISPRHMIHNHLMDNYAAALAAVDQSFAPDAPPTPPAVPQPAALDAIETVERV